METFDPARFSFILLREFQIPGGVSVYEYKNHSSVDGARDFLRLNLYLTMDKNYVTIWHGLLEPIGTEAEFETGRLASVERPADFDFISSYNQDLFRGYIDSDEAAQYIFKALRVDATSRYALPQVLTGGPDNKLRCDRLERTDDASQATVQ